jgi:hypothetical protein
MAKVTYDKQFTALLVIDPYNDFISEGGKIWDRLKGVAEANKGANKNSSPDRREVERSRDVCDPLRSSAGHFLDWSDEIYRIRGERHPTTGGKQSAYGMALWISQRARIFRFTRSSGNCHRGDDWDALAIARVSAVGEHIQNITPSPQQRQHWLSANLYLIHR